jgi:hypothetical protein
MITMTTTSGYARTGNYVLSMRNAMRRAHACKAGLYLPNFTHDNAFSPSKYSFDFSSRIGTVHPDCSNPDIGYGLHGNASIFVFLEALSNTSSEEIEFHANYAPEDEAIHICLQTYLGACDPEYCSAHGHLKNKLVAHLRQGDIYPQNFTTSANPVYGQPPLGYYLSAFGARHWEEVVVVAEPSDLGPHARMLNILADANVTSAPLVFQSGSWSDDLRTLMCAENVVESSSTIHGLLVLGHSKVFYSYRCFPRVVKGRGVYKIPISGEYAPFFYSNNSMAEWLDVLLHDTGPPLLCDPNPEPEILTALDWWLSYSGVH